jgi:hypothetical protein
MHPHSFENFTIEQSKSGLYEPLLQENEREAIAELLQYLESKASGTHSG